MQEDLGMAKSWEQSCRERERFQKSKFSNRLDAVDEKQHRSANLGNGIYSIKIKKKKKQKQPVFAHVKLRKLKSFKSAASITHSTAYLAMQQ